MKNVLVTGGTGFIGSNLAARLVTLGCNVRILRRPNSDLRAIGDLDVDHRYGDVRDAGSLAAAMKNCDTVFHTAAVVTFARKKIPLQYEVNVIGARNVAASCAIAGVERLVHTSSIAAIGYPRVGELATEETVYNWGSRSGYKLSKHLAEAEILAGVANGLDAVIVNPAVVIGERDIHMHGGQIIKEARRGLVPFYLDGGMSVVYVGDVVNGHIQAAQRGRKGERYILSGHNLTHKEIFQRAATLLGGRAPFVKLPIPLLRFSARVIEGVSNALDVEPWISSDLVAGAGLYNWFSCEKAKRELGYALTPFDDTIRAAFTWYTEHGFV